MLGNVAGIYIAEHVTDVTTEAVPTVMASTSTPASSSPRPRSRTCSRRDGNIVNIASNAGLQGVPYSVAYAMTKGGVVQLTRALAVEYIKTRMRVNADRARRARTRTSPPRVPFPSDMDPDLARRMAGFRGIAEPEDVAAVFAFLASDEARAVTGAVYTVDNGITVS